MGETMINYTRLNLYYGGVDEASDGELSVDDDDDDDDGAVSCSSSAAGNQSVNSGAENSIHCHDVNDDDDTATQDNATVAAAALISDQYSVETLLANVQALLKLAMDSARHREQQASIKAGWSSVQSAT